MHIATQSYFISDNNNLYFFIIVFIPVKDLVAVVGQHFEPNCTLVVCFNCGTFEIISVFHYELIKILK